ncbi:tRNA 2-thiouridine synthesizing protein A [Arboricoccus pini]|uniref:tRNA 2-thiouridine synthesizing protein A n=1 Tax=Arboricoccus pini TaxID=1963835 RepID=A0A212QVG7_9PROT|nr:sulfurtransferase TusA family protein [Arboricoccus pini]SNB63516.1 tRNA 2-thiouridine synthesizing protein A [Arboricoccus pini]
MAAEGLERREQNSTSDMVTRHDALVDARGLACPLPLVKARQALMVLEPGAVVCVLATDPAAADDFTNFCEHGGHVLLEIREADGVLKIVLAKRAGQGTG